MFVESDNVLLDFILLKSRVVNRTDMKMCNAIKCAMHCCSLTLLVICTHATWQHFQILDATLTITNTLFVYQICLFALLFYQALSTTIIPTFWQTMLCEQSFQGKVCDVNARKGLDWVQTKPWNSMNINYSATSGHKMPVNEAGLWDNYYFALLQFLNVKRFVW